jgi:rhodanese-related sulfurtransferase
MQHKQKTIGTRGQLIKDLQRVHKLFPDAIPDRDFYRAHGKYADAIWKEYFPRFKDFVQAADVLPGSNTASAPKAVPVELTSEDRLKFDLEKVAVKKEGTQKKYTEALNRIKQLEEENSLLIGLDQHTPQIIDIFPRNSSGGSYSVAVVVFSDWHIEEPVSPDDVSGVNEFNLEIAEKRVIRAWQSALRLYQKEAKETEIKEIIVALLGDFITNRIHEDLAESNLLQPTDAMYKAQGLIISGLRFLLENLPKDVKLIVVCHSGNHGRMTPEQRIKTEAGTSIERFMYFNIRDQFKHEPRMVFQIASGYHTIVRLFDKDKPYVIRFHHGHAIRSSGGVGGIYPPVNKAIGNWNKSVRDVNLDVFGHHHQFVDGQDFICNGSLIGYNSFAVAIKAPYEPPKQAFFLINRKHRCKAMVTPIFVEGDNDGEK